MGYEDDITERKQKLYYLKKISTKFGAADSDCVPYTSLNDNYISIKERKFFELVTLPIGYLSIYIPVLVLFKRVF